ncbi:serine/threonine-protein kinase [Nonomuraea fuscirosea]|uniref:serine/threonine-protein kinase n=1 Tax=Nonomuraea fuscirosea TaxID=1291556 RepID=UPI003428B140
MTAPTHAGRYRIEQLIGVGGFASVHLAHDEELRSSVAVKILADNWSRQAGVRERFLQEARLLRRADSHLLVQVYDVGELDDGRPYFVMTYADRGTLGERLTGPPLPVGEALALMGEICQAVAVLHSIGVVHRDLKPSNVLFCSRPQGGERVMVADLGIARSTDHLSGLTMPAGSPGYQAPEQLYFDGAPDARADVHGLGALTYRLLTGTVPAKPELRVPPSALRPEVPEAVDVAVMAALAPDRRSRYPDAAAYAAALASPTPLLPAAPDAERPEEADEREQPGHQPPGDRPPDDGTPNGRTSGGGTSGDGAPGDSAPGDRASGGGPSSGGPSSGGASGDGAWAGKRRRNVLVGGVAVLAAVLAAATTVGVTLAQRPGGTPSPGATATPSSTGADTGRWLRPGSDVPDRYRALIVEAGTYCSLPGLSPALIAAMLKAESGFDAALSDPANDEFGIARWTPRVLWHWQPGGLQSPMPTPPFDPRLSIQSMGRFMCRLGPRVADVPSDPAMNLAALFRSGVDPVKRAGGVPPKWRGYTAKVARYMRDYEPS